ncbi:pseudouridylate synthase TRUB2, mitochondrial isoform X2 [Balaenoptera acutorostrata]|uniref:Pseudouridylate synthase TRUB2, mitochondrial isoform X2 n=1 Tax=Balaenoptera acutorostrata TaxID=9767 RepID=A0A384B515_BALAC|nr:pseudouridylate synthase TRUB2, mitochondrial isoform X2 [Balaenoptera acutorostrata]
MGLAGLARLHGLFAAYKPPGLKWKHLRDTVELQLLKGLNAGKRPASEHRVRFLLGPMEGSEEKELTLTATSVPTLIDHPLVCGPAFTSLKIGIGHRLDAQASGVLVLGVGRGRSLLTDMYNAHLTKDYTVHGLLGKATDDFCEDGRLVEKTTYDHVTREKLERILALIQGSHQKALVMYSNVDLQTQEAYEMAVSGVMRPTNKSPMLITGIRCLQFAPPEFLLETSLAKIKDDLLLFKSSGSFSAGSATASHCLLLEQSLSSSLAPSQPLCWSPSSPALLHGAHKLQFPIWDRTRAPCSGSMESQPLDRQGSPRI